MTVIGCSRWAESWVPCFQCKFWRAVCLSTTGEKLQAKAVPPVGRTEPVAHFGLTQRGHSHPQQTRHSISVAHGWTHGLCWAPLGLWQLPSSPSSPPMPPHCTVTQAGVHWEPSSSFLGVLLFPDNAEITSATVANTSDCIALQKQTHKVSQWLEPQSCTMNVCTTHIHKTSELQGSRRHIKLSPPHTDIWLLILIHILLGWSWLLSEGEPQHQHSEPGPHSMVSFSMNYTLCYNFDIPGCFAMTFYLRCPGLQKKRAFSTTEVSRMVRWSFQKMYYQQCPSRTPNTLHNTAGNK